MTVEDATMSAKDVTMSAKDATMTAKDATMCTKDATMIAKDASKATVSAGGPRAFAAWLRQSRGQVGKSEAPAKCTEFVRLTCRVCTVTQPGTQPGPRSLHFRGRRPIPRLPELASNCVRPAAALRD